MFSRNRLLFAGVFLALGAAILVASLRGEPQHRLSFAFDSTNNRLVQPAQVATWVIEGRRDFSIVDMRSAETFAAGHIRGAVNCGTCHRSREEGFAAQRGDSFVDLSKKLIIYSDTGQEPIQLPKILRDNPRLYRIDGGWAAWQRDILSPVSAGGAAGEEELLAARKREAVRAFFSGERRTIQRVAKLPVSPIRRRGAHKIAITDEGC
jgi:rhodanese-related sulfurtransferase